MRPEILFPLFAPLRSLPGIGPRLETLIAKMAGPKVVDLCWHLPTGLVDRRHRPKIAEIKDGEIVTVEVQVGVHIAPRQKRLPYRVHVHDETGEMQIVFFNPHKEWLGRTLPEGSTRVLSGKVEFYQGQPQMTHPDHIVSLDELENLPLLEPIYPLTAGVTLKPLQKAIRAAVDLAPELPEWQDAAWLKARRWDAWLPSLRAAHNPDSAEALEPNAAARARLAFDELLANQLALGIVRLKMRKLPGRSIKGDGHLREKVLAALPFALTGSRHHQSTP